MVGVDLVLVLETARVVDRRRVEVRVARRAEVGFVLVLGTARVVDKRRVEVRVARRVEVGFVLVLGTARVVDKRRVVDVARRVEELANLHNDPAPLKAGWHPVAQ